MAHLKLYMYNGFFSPSIFILVISFYGSKRKRLKFSAHFDMEHRLKMYKLTFFFHPPPPSRDQDPDPRVLWYNQPQPIQTKPVSYLPTLISKKYGQIGEKRGTYLIFLYSWTSVIWQSVIRTSLLSGCHLAVYIVYFQLKSCSKQKTTTNK